MSEHGPNLDMFDIICSIVTAWTIGWCLVYSILWDFCYFTTGTSIGAIFDTGVFSLLNIVFVF